jgi:hypothetical protein
VSSLPPMPPPLHFPGTPPHRPRRSSWVTFTTACIGTGGLLLYLVFAPTGPTVPVPSGWCTPHEVRPTPQFAPLPPSPVAPSQLAPVVPDERP